MYVFGTGGDAVGFVFESFIFDLDGAPLGRIVGPRVHRFDGSYVGEWYQQMVVERPTARPRFVHPANRPADRPAVPRGWQRRPTEEHRTYPDAFARLYDGSEPLAAE